MYINVLIEISVTLSCRMVIITRCSVVNKLNESKNLICTEWDELKIKFFIITNDKKLYTGDVMNILN